MHFWLLNIIILCYIFINSFNMKFILLIILELSYIMIIMIYYFYYFHSGYILFFLIFIVLDSMTLFSFFISMIRSSSKKNPNFSVF